MTQIRLGREAACVAFNKPARRPPATSEKRENRFMLDCARILCLRPHRGRLISRFDPARQCIWRLLVGIEFAPRGACLPRLPVPCPTRQTGRCALRRRQSTRSRVLYSRTRRRWSGDVLVHGDASCRRCLAGGRQASPLRQSPSVVGPAPSPGDRTPTTIRCAERVLAIGDRQPRISGA